jgi:hypothetical protein
MKNRRVNAIGLFVMSLVRYATASLIGLGVASPPRPRRVARSLERGPFRRPALARTCADRRTLPGEVDPPILRSLQVSERRDDRRAADRSR